MAPERASSQRRTHRDIATGIPRDRLFGNLTAIRVAGETRRNRHPEITEQDYYPYLFVPIVKKALAVDEERFIDQQVQKYSNRGKALTPIFGNEIVPDIKLSPSSADCLRREGYRILGYKPSPGNTENILARMIGSGAHFSLQRVLRSILPSDMIQTEVWTASGEGPDILGRMDILYFNPLIKEHQIIDLKFIADYGFRKLTREGLPKHMKKTKGIIQPREENRDQVLLYMGDKRSEGYNVNVGNVVYINVNSRQMKEALVIWDDNEYKLKKRLEQMHQAKLDIAKGLLPNAEIGKHCNYCWFLAHCQEGQNTVAQAGKTERKRPLPAYMKKEMEERRKETAQKLIKLGLQQDTLLDPLALGLMKKER